MAASPQGKLKIAVSAVRNRPRAPFPPMIVDQFGARCIAHWSRAPKRVVDGAFLAKTVQKPLLSGAKGEFSARTRPFVHEIGRVADNYGRFAALKTARTLAVAMSVSSPTPNTVRPSVVRHST